MKTPSSRMLLTRIDRVSLVGGVLDFEGYAVFEGVAVTGYGQIKTSIVFHSIETQVETALGGFPNEALNGLMPSHDHEVDYSFGGITSSGRFGIPLFSLPVGRYQVLVKAEQGGFEARVDTLAVPDHEEWVLEGTRHYCTRAVGGKWEILVLSAVGRPASDAYHELAEISLEGGILYLEGYFAPRGREISSYESIEFTLSVAPVSATGPNLNISATIPLAIGSREDVSTRSGEPWRNQSKGYYATPAYEGIELPTLATGEYQLLVTARIGDDLQTVVLTPVLKVEGTYSGQAGKPSIGVIGSCLIRDNFRSDLAPGWRDFYSVHGTHFQMSLVSLMSPAVATSEHQFYDLHAHSAECTRRDFTKEYLEEIAQGKPDILLIDARADARHGVIRCGASWVTNHLLMLRKSEYYSSIRANHSIHMLDDPLEYSAAFRQACELLRSFLARRSPKTRVIWVSAKGVGQYRGLSGAGRFVGSKNPEILNRVWAELDSIAVSVFGCDLIDAMRPSLFASSDYPFGTGPIHYEKFYYSVFRERLLAALDYEQSCQLVVLPPVVAA
ncbi:DUF6270 domain-containing protein [Leucobacter aridicollis]|uniref:Uncharacterized protein n=1 Tax=Leucobacter aridicollis TaxID=283878 RepID=A0A852QVT7_9MICO|nr:DUF6270 domain-containing protein [Leucobacter aridicollis]NYD25451.1 hypothetical protein [Leucobacter aridicollis]